MTSLEGIDTPRIAVSTTYHGVTVTEDYRWLEDAAAEETRAWTAAQIPVLNFGCRRLATAGVGSMAGPRSDPSQI